MKIRKIDIVVIVLVVIALVGWYVSSRTDRQIEEGQVACTADAKVCPDGSAVGRIAPDCEFAKCPSSGVESLDERIIVTNIAPNEKITLPIQVVGFVNGNGWYGNEGEVGTVQIFDAEDSPVSNVTILRATTNWLELPTNFEALVGDREMMNHVKTDTGYLLFISNSTQGGETSMKHILPIVFNRQN